MTYMNSGNSTTDSGLVTEDCVAIKKYKIGIRGLRGMIISIPKIWLEQNDLRATDHVLLLQRPGCTDLIIRKVTPRPQVEAKP